MTLGLALPSQITISFCILVLDKFLDFLAMTYYNEIQLRYLMFPCNQITALGYLKYIIMQQAHLLGKVRT